MADEAEKPLVDIDEGRLDEEWLRQPKLFHKYAIKLANAKADMAEAKVEFDVTQAELASDIRSNPGNYGLSKVTDSAVESTILIQTDYLTAVREYNHQKHRVDVFQAAVNALEHRRSALEALVKLHGQDYFATPRVPKEASENARNGLRKKTRDQAFGKGE